MSVRGLFPMSLFQKSVNLSILPIFIIGDPYYCALSILYCGGRPLSHACFRMIFSQSLPWLLFFWKADVFHVDCKLSDLFHGIVSFPVAVLECHNESGRRKGLLLAYSSKGHSPHAGDGLALRV